MRSRRRKSSRNKTGFRRERLAISAESRYISQKTGNTMPMKKLVHNFIHCGILGWCLEISFTALNSFRRREFTLNGNTSVWMFPIYGMAAFLAPVCRIVKKRHFLVRGFLYAVLIFIGEFVTGSLLMRRELCPWNYSRSKWNIKKVVRLDYLPCWIFAGLLFERLIKETDES